MGLRPGRPERMRKGSGNLLNGIAALRQASPMTLRTRVRHHANQRALLWAPLARRCSACLPAGDSLQPYAPLRPTQVSFRFSPAHSAGSRAHQSIRRGSFRSVKELVQKIDAFVAHYNLHWHLFSFDTGAQAGACVWLAVPAQENWCDPEVAIFEKPTNPHCAIVRETLNKGKFVRSCFETGRTGEGRDEKGDSKPVGLGGIEAPPWNWRAG